MSLAIVLKGNLDDQFRDDSGFINAFSNWFRFLGLQAYSAKENGQDFAELRGQLTQIVTQSSSCNERLLNKWPKARVGWSTRLEQCYVTRMSVLPNRLRVWLKN